MCQVMEELLDKGRAEGMAEGILIGENKGRAEGAEKTMSDLADEMKAAGVNEEMIKMIITSYQAKVKK